MDNVAAVTCRDHKPNSQEANLVVVQTHPLSWSSKFHELYDHLTPDQWSFPHGVSTLHSLALEHVTFRRLLVGQA